MFGMGLALAVIMDATLVRAALVPAFMKLMGSANWWAPPALRRVHERFGIREAAVGGVER
jgi:RND superfamily putative drug exporter